MSTIPTTGSVIDISSEINGKGDIDILHVIGQDQTVKGWLDVNGVPGGTLAEGNSVVSVNGTPVNDPNFKGGTDVTLVVSGSDVTVNATGAQGPPGTSNVPWVDITAYGGNPHQFAFNQPTAGCTTASGSPNVTIAAGTLASALKNSQGVCIWAAGASTSQSTPSAPTATSPAVQGSQTLTYACVGYDKLGGLTAASSSGTVTNAPAIFGSLPVALSSISVTSDVCSVVFASPVNNSVAAGMTVHIVGVTGKTDLNGIWTTASFADTTHCTFAITSADGSGTITSATGRVSNSAIITAISRAANGVVTVTTAENHNFQHQTGRNPTIVNIEGVTEELVGVYAIASVPTSTSFTFNTGIFSALTGSIIGGVAGVSGFATVWEFITVACPTLSGSTIGYYIYSDSAAPGGSLALIGKCVYGEYHFTDWGPSIASGYGAPAYVPTTAPVAAQAQMLSTTIASGGGTTSLVLNANAGQTITSLGGTIMFDDGPNLKLAAAAISGTNGIGGTVLISPPTVATSFPAYIFNSPIVVAEGINITFGCPCIVNETITYTAFNQINALEGSPNTVSPQFGLRNYVDIHGVGNPMFSCGNFGANGTGSPDGNNGSIEVEGLCFTCDRNGQIGLEFNSATYTKLHNCAWQNVNENYGSTIGVLYNGSSTALEVKNVIGGMANRFFSGGNGVAGQSCWGPPIGSMCVRASDNANAENPGTCVDNFIMIGNNTWAGRGILFDQLYAFQQPVSQGIQIGDGVWNQAATTPFIMLWGNIYSDVTANKILNDTSQQAAIANWATQCYDVYCYAANVSGGGNAVTGNFIRRLFLSGENAVSTSASLQRMTCVSFTSSSDVSDAVLIPNLRSNSVASIAPTNASAAADMAAGNVFILSKAQDVVTIVHSATANMTFDITATVSAT